MNLNSVYITIGFAIILVLVTALVGPFFVDWTVYRSTFETYAERALGHKVTVLGEADIRLLPTPTVTFSDVRVGAKEDPLLVVSQFKMTVELPPLLKGEIRVLDMTLDRPHLSLALDEQGRLDWLTAMQGGGAIHDVADDDIAFENITVTDGAISLIDARTGKTHRIDDGNLQVSARTLAGPYKVDGSLTYEGEPYSIRLATGKRHDDGSIRVKASALPSAHPVEISVDGSVSHADETPMFEGGFTVSSIVSEDTPDQAWRVGGQLSASVARLDVPSFEFRYGPEDRLLGMDGQARLDLEGEHRFEIRAKAKQLDLDRLYGGGPQEPVSPDEVAASLLKTLKSLPRPKTDGVIALDVPAIVAGGGLVQDVRMDLETIDGGWRVARLAGRAPGRTTVALQGDLSLSSDASSFRGNLSVSSEQPGSLIGWIGQSETSSSAMQPISIGGRLNVVPDGAALDDLRFTLAGSEATGGLSYRKPRQGNPIFSLSLDANVLDLDELEEFAGLFHKPVGEAQLDVSLRLRARQVDVRGIEGKGLAMEADYSGGGLRIDRLFAEDLAGAQIDVAGQIEDLFTAPSGVLSGRLNATNLEGVVAVLGGLWPDSLAVRRLDQAADYLVPARFDAELRATSTGDGSDATLVFDGVAGGVDTRLDATFKGRTDAWTAADVDATLSLSGPDGGQILRQLGFDVLPVDDLGGSEFKVTAEGRPRDGLELTISARAGEASVGVDGQLRLSERDDPRYSLSVIASVPDLAPFALLAGRVMPVMAGDIDADVRFDLTGTGTKIAISDLSGTVGGISVDGAAEGDLRPAPGEPNRRFKGELHLGSLDLKYLSEMILGPDLWFSAGDGSSAWPTAAFGAPLFASTDLTLDLKADDLILEGDQAISNARAELRLTPVLLRLDDLSGGFAGGKLTATLALRRSGAQGAVSGRINLDNAILQSLSWTRNGRAVATGALDMALDFEGAGRSIALIVSGLTGGGTFMVSDGELRGLNPMAFGHVIRAADAGLDLRDETIKDLFVNHMEAGSLPFERLEGAISIIGGRVSARNVSVDTKNAGIFGSAEVDLSTFQLKSDFALKVDPGENAVTGAEPQVGLLFSGPVDAPERRIDIAPFTAYLTLRAFEQEVERVEKLQDEILERDRLFREMKREKEDRARALREANEAAEQAARDKEDAAAQDALRQREAAEQTAADRQAAEEAARQEVAREEAAREEAVRLSADPTAGQTASGGASRTEEQSAATAPAVSSGEAPQAVEGNAADGLDPVDFANRIRSVLEAPANDNAGGFETLRADGSLPPLDAPQTVEDLIGREIGRTFQDDVATGSTTPARSSGPAVQATPPPASRYRTLPSGLVIEMPAN